MSYTLTLTHEERKAIDWIGNRYRHGDELFDLLWCQCKQIPDNVEWNDDQDITFIVPEHIAWTITDIIEENNGALDCFGPELCKKLHNFAMQVV